MTLQHHSDITMPLFFIYPTPPAQVEQCKGAPVCPSTAYQSAQIYDMDVGCILWGFESSTMTL